MFQFQKEKAARINNFVNKLLLNMYKKKLLKSKIILYIALDN